MSATSGNDGSSRPDRDLDDDPSRAAFEGALETETSRRRVLQGVGAIGTAAVIGTTASSGTASATVAGMPFYPTGPTVTGLLFAEALGSVGHNEDPTRDEITLHNQCTGAKAWWDAALDMIRDSRLEDASMSANIEARAAIADAWEDNRTQSEARDDALAAIAEFFNTPARNATETVSSALTEISYAATAARADSDIDDRFVAFTIPSADYTGTGSVVESGSQVDGEPWVTHTVDLPTGDTYEVDAPSLSHEWDNGDTLTITLGDVQSGYSDADENVTLSTADGNEVTNRLPVTIMNVPDADLESKTVLVLSEWADVMDEIETMSSQVRGNYDTTLVGDIYSALDAGDISPSDVRGVEGLAEHLSGSTDATSSRYQMALMNQLGLERNDLSNVASMTADYTGYTSRTIERTGDGSIDSVTLSDRVDAETMEGQLFGELGDGTTLSSGQSYLTGEVVFSTFGDTMYAISTSRNSVLWSYSGHSGDVYSIAVSPDGETVYTAGAGEVHALSATDGSVQWTNTDVDGSSGAGAVHGMAVSPDGETVYASHDAVHAISTSDGTQQWSYGPSGTVEDVSVAPDGETIYAGADSVVAISSDGTEQWVYSDISSVNGVAASPDGSTVFGASHNGPVHGVTADGSQKWALSGRTEIATSVAVSPDSETVYFGSYDQIVHAHAASDGTEQWTYSGHSGNTNDVVASADGSTVYSVGGALHAIAANDGSALWSNDYGDGSVSVRDPPTEIAGSIGRAIFFDAPDGKEYELVNGLVTITELTNKDGETIDESESFDWDRPEHDSTDMSEYRTYVEETSVEHENAIAAEEDGGPIFPTDGDGNCSGLVGGFICWLGDLLGFGDLSWLRDDIAGFPMWAWITGAAAYFSFTGDS